MSRKGKTGKNIIIEAVVLLVFLTAILLNWGIHCKRTDRFNETVRTEQTGEGADGICFSVYPRGNTTDQWEKASAFGEDSPTLYGKIWEFLVQDKSDIALQSWTARFNIHGECLINNCWNGTLEIHQGDKSQTLFLLNYNPEDIELDYYMSGSDLLIPLSEGDYLIYHPDVQEEPMKSGAEIACGMIFYTYEGDVDLTDCELSYNLHKDYSVGTEATIFVVLMSIWSVVFLVLLTFNIVYLYYAKKEAKDRQRAIESLDVFSSFVDAKDPYTSGHSQRVAVYAEKIAEKLGLSQTACDNVYFTALAHDIGKCYVSDSILKKPGALTDEEFDTMKSHTTHGAEMLKNFTSVPNIVEGALYHHERYDGKGYPTGAKGEEIPLIGRIICVADSFDAMHSNRVYRKKLTEEKILDELKSNRGKQFDPKIVDVFLAAYDEITKAAEE